MATVSIVLRKDRVNKEGKAPINFFVIKNRKLIKVTSGIMIEPQYWDADKRRVKKGLDNSARINAFLATKYSELQDEVLKQETATKLLTVKQLKDKIYGKASGDFFEFAETAFKAYLSAGQIATHDKSKSIIRKLKNYCNDSTLTFQDITPAFLYKYENHLREFYNNSTNTIHKDLRFIRKLFNDAFRQDLITHGENPFLKYRLKLEKTSRTYLTEDELSRFEDYKTEKPRIEMHKDMFVFAAYAGGIRVSDVLQLKHKNIAGEHLSLVIKKTGQQISIKLPTKAIEIINKYRSTGTTPESFVFPMLPDSLDMNDPVKVDNEISRSTAIINKNLKTIAATTGIQKNLSFHISRHTWATRALLKGISIDKVSKLMGHAAIKETQIYAKIVNAELDKAMDVFN